MEVQREALLSAIEMVLPAMAKREIFDQANMIAFVGGRVVAFNDAVMISHPLPGALDLEGALDGRRLCDLLDKLDSEVVDLAVDGDKINLRAGRSRASFDALPVTLPIDSVDVTGELVDLPDTFVDQLRWASTSCAREVSRPTLTCVLVEGGWMQSSDSYRASRVHCGDVSTGAWDLPRLMLPLSQVEVLVDYPVKRVALSDGGEWARFETDAGTTLCARSMAGAFPDLASIYDVSGKEVELTDALSDALERARIFARRDRAADEVVLVSMRPNQVTVSAQCDGARFSEVVRCEGAAEAAEFSIHPKFLASALESGTRCVLGERSVKFSGKDWEHVVALKEASRMSATGPKPAPDPKPSTRRRKAEAAADA
jgi:hypothetical protein